MMTTALIIVMIMIMIITIIMKLVIRDTSSIFLFILKDEELLKHYFDLGFSYSEIWAFLAFAHGIYFR